MRPTRGVEQGMVRSRVWGVRRQGQAMTLRVPTSRTNSTMNPIRTGKKIRDENGARLCPRQRAQLNPILQDIECGHEVESAEGVVTSDVEE